jgi:hypothetical protein
MDQHPWGEPAGPENRAFIPTGDGAAELLVEVFLWLGSRGHQDLLGVLVAQAKASTLRVIESRFLLLGGLLRWLIIDFH